MRHLALLASTILAHAPLGSLRSAADDLYWFGRYGSSRNDGRVIFPGLARRVIGDVWRGVRYGVW